MGGNLIDTVSLKCIYDNVKGKKERKKGKCLCTDGLSSEIRLNRTKVKQWMFGKSRSSEAVIKK